MDLKTLVERLNEFADKDLACDWDNVGLLVEPSGQHIVKKLLVTNDLTEPVLDEAINLGVNFIVSYHPAIFDPLKRLTQAEWKQRQIVKCIENRIAIYSPHTTWDAVDGGINDAIFDELGMGVKNRDSITKVISTKCPTTLDHSAKVNLNFNENKDSFIHKTQVSSSIKFVSEKTVVTADKTSKTEFEFVCDASGLVQLIELIKQNYDEATLSTLRISKLEKPLIKNTGLGRSGELNQPRSLRKILDELKTMFKMKTFRVGLANGKTLDDTITTVAVGAGSALLVWKGTKADLLITGELNHHEMLKLVHRGVSLVVTDHSDTERCFLPVFKQNFTKLLAKYGESVEILISSVDQDPLFYY